MCAIDALGIAAMLRRAVTIHSTEPDTGKPITVTVHKRGSAWSPTQPWSWSARPEPPRRAAHPTVTPRPNRHRNLRPHRIRGRQRSRSRRWSGWLALARRLSWAPGDERLHRPRHRRRLTGRPPRGHRRGAAPANRRYARHHPVRPPPRPMARPPRPTRPADNLALSAANRQYRVVGWTWVSPRCSTTSSPELSTRPAPPTPSPASTPRSPRRPRRPARVTGCWTFSSRRPARPTCRGPTSAPV